MAWVGQCRIAFKVDVDKIIAQQKGRKNITKALKQLARDSGVSFPTLKKWYYSSNRNRTKNGPIEQGAENGDEKGCKTDHPDHRPICSRCNRNPVKLIRGKPLSSKAKYFGLCNTCIERQTAIEKLDKEATPDDGIEAICPDCHKHFFINLARVNGKEIANERY